MDWNFTIKHIQVQGMLPLHCWSFAHQKQSIKSALNSLCCPQNLTNSQQYFHVVTQKLDITNAKNVHSWVIRRTNVQPLMEMNFTHITATCMYVAIHLLPWHTQNLNVELSSSGKQQNTDRNNLHILKGSQMKIQNIIPICCKICCQCEACLDVGGRHFQQLL